MKKNYVNRTNRKPGRRGYDCGWCGKRVKPYNNSLKCDGWHWHKTCWTRFLRPAWAALMILAASVFYTSAGQTVTSWYGEECAGRPMANGKPFKPEAFTCASWDYPLGTRLKVCHKNRVVFVTVTDRGPAKRLVAQGRRLDLSRAAFERLAPLRLGLIKVDLRVLK